MASLSTRLRHRIGLIVFACLCLGLFPANAATIATLDGPPEGFEQLDAPRPTSVTLYFGGDILGQFPAHFSPGLLHFDDAESVIKAVPGIINAPVIHTIFSQPLPGHGDLLCTAKRSTDCGRLDPEIAGVIFDETQLRAEIFINKKYLAVQDAASERYLPLPKRQFASVYGFNGAVAGTDKDSPNFTLSNQAIQSFGEMKLVTQSTLATEGLRFDTVAASTDRNGWNATGGLFRSRPMQLLSDRDIAGVSVATSRRTVLDSNKTEGNDIIIYLQRRAFVSIYREGRLYSSQAYEAGNQQINTAELPEGAYTITLKIQEADGTTREETRFFVKTENIPAKGHPVYFAQAGVARKIAADDNTIPELNNDPVLRLGTVRRVTDTTGFTTSALGVADRAIVENGIFMLLPGRRMDATLLGSTKGDAGLQAGYIQTSDKVSIAVDARKLWLSQTPIPAFEDMTDDVLQASAIITYAVTPALSLGFRSAYARQAEDEATTSFGPYAEWRLWQNGENMLSFNANAAHADGRNQGSFFVQFTRRLGQYGYSATAGAGAGGSENGPIANGRIWHQDDTPGNALALGAGVTTDSANRTVSGDADWQNSFGQVRGTAQESFGKNGSTFGFGGNFSVNAAQLADEIHVGGQQSDQSAIIIATTGDVAVPMKIMVNGVARGMVDVGRRQVIYLNPFQTYHIRLVPEKSALLDYDSSDKKVTLYPGNVVRLDWSVDRFFVVTAHITHDGQALKDAVLKESRTQIATDDTGYVQAELARPSHLTFTLSDDRSCQVTLPHIDDINGVLLYHQPLPCQDDSRENTL